LIAKTVATYGRLEILVNNTGISGSHRRRVRHRRRLYRPIALSRRAIGDSAISELATRRSEFAAVLPTSGIDTLIASLIKKADDRRT
jgi:NAD(P)-dependent dehydrogenase (short-subunit alcohol dehydrogenase family)